MIDSVQPHRVILASASPRRKELLSYLSNDFDVIVPAVDESFIENETVDTYVARISATKCISVLKKIKSERGGSVAQKYVVIAADTTVYIPDQEILGKPHDSEHARIMLKSLSGKMHQVKTAFSIGDTNTGEANILTNIVTTAVYFQNLNDRDIEEYLRTDEPYDKAGSYALQGIASQFISHIHGSHTNVIGLPLAELRLALTPFLEIAP